MSYRNARMSRDLARASELVRVGAISDRRSCIYKVSYPTLNDARHAAKGVFAKTGRNCTTYACQFCKGWHTTKMKYGEDEGYTYRDVEGSAE